MAYNNYKWNRPFRKDPHGLIAKKHILQRIIDRNTVALFGSGSPFVIWHHGYDLFKQTSAGTPDICWCHRNNAGPDARHRICWGTGYLVGFQKYGYNTITWTTTSSDITLTNVRATVDQSTKKEIWVLSGTSTGIIETNFISLTNIKNYSYFVHTESNSANVTYLYSYDGIIWNVMPTDISTLDITQAQIKIRAVLAKLSPTDRMPFVEWFRFRFQNEPTLGEQHIEYRNTVNIPCYVASKSFVPQVQTKQNMGLTFDYPLTFWSIIKQTFGPRDIGMFLTGHFKGRRFFATNLRESTYGEDCTLMHTMWDVRFVFGQDDASGIIYSLD